MDIKQASKLTKLSIRTLQAKCKANNIQKVNGIYDIKESFINEWRTKERNERNEIFVDDTQEQNLIVEEFSPEQYEKLQEVIHTYPVLLDRIKDYKNEIEYLRTSLDKTHDQFEMLLKRMESTLQIVAQRNWIEAKTKTQDDNHEPPY
jgi:hypothetical protein